MKSDLYENYSMIINQYQGYTKISIVHTVESSMQIDQLCAHNHNINNILSHVPQKNLKFQVS